MKRFFGLLLALTLLLSLCACASTPAANDTKEPPPAEDTNTPEQDTTTDDETNDTTDDTTGDSTGDAVADDLYEGVKLPLTDETVTFTYFRNYIDSNYNQLQMDFDDALGFQVAEQLTNVHIDWQLVTDFDTQFNLMVASGDWPDAASSWTASTFGVQLNVLEDNGVVLDLTDLIETYAPHYQALRLSDESVRRDTMTDDGKLVGIYNIEDPVHVSWMGPVARKDWVEEWGGGTIETYDDWETYMQWAVDNKQPYSSPFILGADGVMNSYLLAGFDLYIDWIVRDGQVVYCPTDPAFKDFVTLLHDWHEKGFITDANFSGTRIPFDDYACGGAAMMTAMPSWFDMLEGLSGDGQATFTAVQCPVKNRGDKRIVEDRCSWETRLEGLAAYIFADCENPELLVQWHDFFFTRGGSLLADYGVEGVSYEFDENGDPVFSEAVTNAPDGIAFNTTWLRYIFDQIPHRYDWLREVRGVMNEDGLACYDIWDGNFENQLTFPQYISRTPEEGEEYASIMSDINTYLEENVSKMCMGDIPMSEWDNFIAKFDQMNIDRAREIQQAAYDRYIAR